MQREVLERVKYSLEYLVVACSYRFMNFSASCFHTVQLYGNFCTIIIYVPIVESINNDDLASYSLIGIQLRAGWTS